MFTSRQVMDGELPILLVTHDGEDGAWQFVHGTETDDLSNGILVHPEHLVDLDPSVASLEDLPRGWIAWRPEPEDPWTREPEGPPGRLRELRDRVRGIGYRLQRRLGRS